MFWKRKVKVPKTCKTSWFIPHDFDNWGDVFNKPGMYLRYD